MRALRTRVLVAVDATGVAGAAVSGGPGGARIRSYARATLAAGALVPGPVDANVVRAAEVQRPEPPQRPVEPPRAVEVQRAAPPQRPVEAQHPVPAAAPHPEARRPEPRQRPEAAKESQEQRRFDPRDQQK